MAQRAVSVILSPLQIMGGGAVCLSHAKEPGSWVEQLEMDEPVFNPCVYKASLPASEWPVGSSVQVSAHKRKPGGATVEARRGYQGSTPATQGVYHEEARSDSRG